MLQFDTRKTSVKVSEKKNSPNTLVLFAVTSGKHFEAIGLKKEAHQLMQDLSDDGLVMADLKKGVFLRGTQVAGYRNALIIGLDDKYKSLEDVRRLGGTVYQHLSSNKVTAADVLFAGLCHKMKNPSSVAHAFVEGALLCDYKFDKYKSKTTDAKKADSDKKLESLHMLVSGSTAAVDKAIEAATVLVECVNFSRLLGDTPGNLMTPEILAETAAHAAKGTKLKVTAWDKAKIKKERMGGLIGISLGSAVDPRFIIMEYNGAAKSKAPVCFVGKGLTFDCGGISIKPSAAMEEMKYDMCGGANVIGTMLAIAKLKLKINAIGLVPATENMPGPLATKPGDILVARNGKTVEIDNTDAEGRVILMDALSYACEQKPKVIFDAATLTGACVVALGNSYTGFFTRDEKVSKNIRTAAESTGEMVWQLPLCDHYVNDMKGTYADLNNISSFKGAGASTAAAFLEQFVDKDIPWAHFDIAGTAWHVGNRHNYYPRKGASGVMIRTFVELAKIYG